MGSGGEEGHPDRSGQTPRTPGPPPSPDHTTRSPRARPPAPPFRNVNAPLAAVQPPPSPPGSVYHSLSVVAVGAVTLPGGHGLPAHGLPAPRRQAHRAPPGHRRAPGGLPARSGGGRRRYGPAAVRRARVPGVPDVRSWAALMHRAFGIDVLACPQCGGRLRLIATLHDPAVIRKILAHLALGHSGQSPGPAPPESGAAAP